MPIFEITESEHPNRSLMAKQLCLVLPLLLLGRMSVSQPFSCDGTMYVALLDQGQGTSGLFAITPGESLAEASITPVQINLGAPIQVLGFSVHDNHIYGFNPANYHMYRINASGQLDDLGVPSTLDTVNFTYLAGEIGQNGNPFRLIARSKATGYDSRLYSVRLFQAGLPASWVSVVSDVPVRIEDMAFDPVLGELVGYDSANNRMVSINTAGVVTSAGFATAGSIESMGAVFFDRAGRLYGYGGRTNLHNSLFEFNRLNGRLTGSKGGANGRSSDGCACPYQIHFTKRIEPAVVLPCTEVTITYHFHNSAAIAYGQVRIIDTLPDFFTITAIDRPPFFGEVQSGVGSSVFEATGMQVLLGRDSVVIRARVGNAPPGLYGSRALAGPFPLAFGNSLRSDDPLTPAPGDPTLVEILDSGGVLGDTAVFVCPGAQAVLRTSVQAQSILWSTGEQTPEIEAGSPGLYWAELEGACGIYRDTIRVEEINTGLRADAGPDREIYPGERIGLSVRHNSNGPLSYRWESSSGDSLSCSDCAAPFVSPLKEALFSVTITDEYGCTADAVLRVKVKSAIPAFVPTAFSPDDNGINDVFFAQGPPGIEVEYLRVFDRWGGLVFESRGGMVNDPAHGWNGKSKGRAMPQGMYIWTLGLRLADGSTREEWGEVLLLRRG